jgi:hypothetical protein
MAKKRARTPNAEYILPKVKLLPSTKRLLALDPGSRNMGISIVATNSNRKVKVVANAIVTNPIYDLTQFGTQRALFLDEMDRWIELYKPDGIIAERFQTRGGSSMGPLIECVSSMNGLLAGHYNIPVKFITAATWKNNFHRRFPKHTLDELYRLCRTAPHQLDSSLIGVYGLEIGLDLILDYKPLAVIKAVEDSSLIRLINRRN